MGKKVAVVMWIGLVMLGVVFSIADYKRWKYEETKNFGHGPTESLTPPKDLTARYENSAAGIRLAYPTGWKTEENQVFTVKDRSGSRTWETLTVTGKPINIVTIERAEVSVEVGMEKEKDQGTVLLEGEVNRLKSTGIVFTKERDYLNTDRENWIVLTWEEGSKVIRYAITSSGERLVFVKVKIDKNVFNEWTRTVDEIIKNVTLI